MNKEEQGLTRLFAGISFLDGKLGNKLTPEQEAQGAGYLDKAYNQYNKKQ